MLFKEAGNIKFIFIARDDSSQPHTMAAEQTTFFTVSKAAKTEAEVWACLEFLDKMSSDEMKMLCGYGLVGIHWEMMKREDRKSVV